MKTRFLGLASLTALSALLAGCLATPGDNYVFPEPVQTPLVLAVKATPVPGAQPDGKGQIPTYATAFNAWKVCRPGSGVWQESDEHVVLFNCRSAGLGGFLFRWHLDNPTSQPRLMGVTYMGQDDVEYAGIELRGPDAKEILSDVFANRVPAVN